MAHHELHTAVRPNSFNRLLDRLTNWLLATEDDAKATARGWQVSRVPKSRRRVYRDPRWDTVHVCAPCGGTGLLQPDEIGCPACAGIGVVRSVPTAAVAADLSAGQTGVRP